MLMTNFLKDRKSTRDFRNTKVDLDIIEKIKSEIESLEDEMKDFNVGFRVYENGANISKGFKDVGGYSGVMIESPHYIAIKMEEDGRSIVAGSYYAEELISKLHELGLDSCWVTLEGVNDEDKIKVLGESQENVEYLLAMGYPKRKDPFATEESSPRKPISEVVFIDEIGKSVTTEDLENRGLLDLFYYVRYAPSQKNLQPWRFLIEDNEVTLLMVEEHLNLTDAGIVMYYFEGLAKAIGVSSQWELIDFESHDGYKSVAKIKL